MTTRHRALLIGASDYDEPGIRSLPFVRDDLARLSAALTERGFHSAEVAESKRGITLNFVKEQVSRFLREAKRDDSLIILLSGHGQHYEGTDYLIPEDASFHVHPFASSCVPIDWGKELNECPAQRVVFLIDACREGIEQDSMGPAGVEGWSRRKQAAALRREVAYVYACSPGQYALFVQEREAVREGADVETVPGESFSLFSRAVCDVVGGLTHALDLAEFEAAVQERIAELHTAYGKSRPLQLVRVRTEAEKSAFAVLPGPLRDPREHPWVRAVAGHPAWERIDPDLCAARDTLKELCVERAGRLAEAYERNAAALRDDPWHDAELAKRVHEKAEFLTGKLAKDARLSPTEAAVLTLMPFVSQAFWAQEAARRIAALSGDEADRTPESDAFSSFIQSYPRLDRRLRRLRQTGATDESAHHIRWWLFHRWLLQQPDVYAPQALKELLGSLPCGPEHPAWTRDVLSGDRLIRFIKDQRTAPFATPRLGELADHEPIAASTIHEHEVRESLVACLAKAAHALAVDPVDLPEVVAEHLGISDSVDLTELRTTLCASQWLSSGAGRALATVCQHPAVEIALQEHAQRVDSLLRDINQSSAKAGHALAPLSTLPPYANAGRVRPSGSAPANLSSGIRFHLAEDRVQELLMGEELYGDRGLAVRELYQNALDACRYRDARTTYLRRTGRRVEEWEGLIEFVQGVDESGRPYLECRDNGIGMGVNELSRTFSQGGARFVDLPEYVEEAADWAELDPPVELFPNSRFGIGVLSYFMLADEITVHTCRLDREGHPRRLVKVTIAGPGNLFRIEDEGPGEWAGTRVRLHLTTRAAQQSALDQLTKVLWVAPYRTQVVHGSRTQEWEPGILRADLAALYEEPRFPARKLGHSYPSCDPNLWWAQKSGIVLADGILTDNIGLFYSKGVIVNLHGKDRPLLSVDRRRMRSYSAARVHSMMRAAIPSLFDNTFPGAQSVVTRAWLGEVSEHTVTFADEVTDQAGEVGVTWPVEGQELPAAITGFFPPDTLLLSLVTGAYSPPVGHRRKWPFLVRMIPAAVLRWRLPVLYAAGIGDGPSPVLEHTQSLPIARPSDLYLLSSQSDGTPRAWYGTVTSRDSARQIRGAHLSAFQKTGWPTLQGLFRWRSPSANVTAADVFSCVARTQRSAAYVVTRLSQLGYYTPELFGAVDVVAADVALLKPIGQHKGWLSPGSVLSMAQISYSAAHAGCSPSEAAARLTQLGYRMPDHSYRTTPWAPEDAQVLRALWFDGEKPIPADRAHEISTARIAYLAFSRGRSVGALVELLQEAGFAAPSETARLDLTQDDDSILLSDDLPVDRPVPRGQLAALALRLGRPVSEVAQRLTTLGFRVPDPLPDASLVTAEDAELFKNRRRVSGARWPAEEEPLDVFTLRKLGERTTTSLYDLTVRLTAIGYHIAPDPALLQRLDATELTNVPNRSHKEPITKEELYATAQLIDSSMDDIADGLTRLGLVVEPIPAEFRADIAAEEVLAEVLDPYTSATAESMTQDSRIGPISLPALASVAMRYQSTFHEVALLATRLGMAHEAEEWFG
ncbi:HD domain-containing protein [Streptomyces sp. LZ34]